MWTRGLLKNNAKNALSHYYWTAFGVCILAGIIMAGSSGINFSVNFNLPSDTITQAPGTEPPAFEEFLPYFENLIGAIQVISIIGGILGLAFVFAYQAFLGGPIEAGLCGFFVKARNGDVSLAHLFDNFGSGKYLTTVKAMFLRFLYTFLWSLLLIIPGIVKSYEYYLIPYLMAENPKLSSERAFEISKRTMDGEKFNLFILELSFIGWYLLGYFACCVGMVFVTPYAEATYAEFYACMRAKMIAYGYTTEEELTGTSGTTSGGTYNTGNPNPTGTENPYNTGNPYGTPDPTGTGNPYNTGNPYGTPDPAGTENPYNTGNPYGTPDPAGTENPYSKDNSSSFPDPTQPPNPYDL